MTLCYVFQALVALGSSGSGWRRWLGLALFRLGPALIGTPGVVAADVASKPSAILVVAPHPDDESIMTAGVIAKAKSEGRRVAIAVVTNGDLGCDRDGLAREAETVAAMAALGVGEEDIFFLGYPDGYLEVLTPTPLQGVSRRWANGFCGPSAYTYAARGAGRTDVHSARTGTPAPYTSTALTDDLATLVERVRPDDIYVSHPIDEHPDHAFVYTYVRRALERSTLKTVRIHRALVHIGGCWPTAPTLPTVKGSRPCPEVAFAPTLDAPDLPPPLQRYRPSELAPVPDAMRNPNPIANPKFVAIASYPSQTGPLNFGLSYLFSFARAREPFFVESLVEEGGRMRRQRAFGSSPGLFTFKGEWQFDEAGARRVAAQKAPLRCVVPDMSEGGSWEFLSSSAAAYALRRVSSFVVLERRAATGRGSGRVLAKWPVPAWARRPSDLEVTVDLRPDEGGAGEITVRLDGEVLGVAVDPEPLRTGDLVTASGVELARAVCTAL